MSRIPTHEAINELRQEWKPYLNQLSFRLASLDEIPRAHGLYGFWFRRRCLYVGQAKGQTIAERLKQHWRHPHNKYLSDWIKADASKIQISYLIIDRLSEIDFLERHYISKFQPITNKHHI